MAPRTQDCDPVDWFAAYHNRRPIATSKPPKVVCVQPTHQQIYDVPSSSKAEDSLWKLQKETKYTPDTEAVQDTNRDNTKMIINDLDYASGPTISTTQPLKPRRQSPYSNQDVKTAWSNSYSAIKADDAKKAKERDDEYEKARAAGTDKVPVTFKDTFRPCKQKSDGSRERSRENSTMILKGDEQSDDALKAETTSKNSSNSVSITFDLGHSPSKLSAQAAPFVTREKPHLITPPPSHPATPVQTTNAYRPPLKLSAEAAPFVSPPQSQSFEPLQVHSISKLSSKATPFIMSTSAVTPRAKDELSSRIQRLVVVGGHTGPWPQYGVPCNDDNLITADGLNQNELVFDDCVSEAGIEGQPRQIVRATQGHDATTELVDWDGLHWAPPPVSWEHDRAGFDNGFLNNYIQEWLKSAIAGEVVTIGMANEAFMQGRAPIDNDVLIAPFSQPRVLKNPDPSYNDKPTKAVSSAAAAEKVVAAAKRVASKQQAHEAISRGHYQEIAEPEPFINQFAPKVEMYLRPVHFKDAAHVAAIYNLEMQTSSITEDQKPVTVEQMKWLIEQCMYKKPRGPFIVAVAGPAPNGNSMHNPERVIGFARAEPFEFGLAGATDGRSRGSANLSVYVDPKFRQKRVGFSLMDRLLHILTPSYAYMEGAIWKPDCPSHLRSGECGLYHQLFMKIPIQKQNDPNAWLKDFFWSKFFFKQVARLDSAVRSSCADGGARFMDLVILQREASNSREFEHYF